MSEISLLVGKLNFLSVKKSRRSADYNLEKYIFPNHQRLIKKNSENDNYFQILASVSDDEILSMEIFCSRNTVVSFERSPAHDIANPDTVMVLT